MRKSYFTNSCLILFLLFVSLNFFSCSTTQKIKYFQDIPDSGQLKTIPSVTYVEPKIQVGDIVTVIIQTIDPTASQMINSGNSSFSPSVPSPVTSIAGSGGAASLLSQQGSLNGYLVDKEGNIDLPVLGKTKAAGYTTSELKNIVYDMAGKLYNNPTVIVRYANFKISVTGEVNKPGVYIMPSEKVTIMDAITTAGDLTIFGKRENVLLIRENMDGTKTPYRINLKKSDVLASSNYYLRQNDLIYVEPRKAKSDATDASQQKYITIAGALLSIILVLAYRVK